MAVVRCNKELAPTVYREGSAPKPTSYPSTGHHAIHRCREGVKGSSIMVNEDNQEFL